MNHHDDEAVTNVDMQLSDTVIILVTVDMQVESYCTAFSFSFAIFYSW